MRTIRTLVILNLVLVGGSFLIIYKAKSELDVSASVQISAPTDFYQPLGTCGSWVDVHAYGHCFRPARVDADWRPYCAGSWVWTDCGWYWQSDEPWAWACYHYGSWVDDPEDGWIWVPAIEWSPAWVTWRTGGDFVGWAPCAPRGAAVAPASFVFVDTHHFEDPIRRASVTVNNAAAIRQTRLLAGPSREQRNIGGRTQEVAINHGPDVEAIQKVAGRKIDAVPVSEAIQRTTVPRNLTPASHNIEPVPTKQPAVMDHKGQQQLPAPDRRDESRPAQQRDLTPEKPVMRPPETTPPPTQRPEAGPKQETPMLPRQDERPLNPPAEQQKVPAERQVVPGQARQLPPGGKPTSPPHEQKPVQKDNQPANPPQQPQQREDKKDGLNGSPSMLAALH